MKKEYLIEPFNGKAIGVKKDQKVTVIDVKGKQVADFFAECNGKPEEFLSPAVTLDCNESLRIDVGSYLYSNLYRPMFKVVADDVGKHDLLFPCCRQEMYDFFYQNGKGHPNCFDNINQGLNEKRLIINPVNLFMNTEIDKKGKIIIHEPISHAGDKIVFSALMDLKLCVASWSVSEAATNGGSNSAIKVTVE